MATTIATAYVQMMPSMQGFAPALEAELKGTITAPLDREAKSAGLTAGRTVGTNLARSIESTASPLVGSTLTKIERQSTGVLARIRAAAGTAVQAYGGTGAVLTGLSQQASGATKELKGLVLGSSALTSATGGLKGGLGAVSGLLGGPWGVAVAGAGLAINGFITAQENADTAAKTLSDTLDRQTGKFTAASIAQVAQAIVKDLDRPGDLALLKGMNVDLGQSVVALANGGTALDSYIAKLSAQRDALTASSTGLRGGAAATDAASQAHARQRAALDGLISSLVHQRNDSNSATQKFLLQAQASDIVATASRALGIDVQGASSALTEAGRASSNAAAGFGDVAGAASEVDARIRAIPKNTKITAKAVGLDEIIRKANLAAAALLALAGAQSSPGGPDTPSGAQKVNIARANALRRAAAAATAAAGAAISAHNTAVKVTGGSSGNRGSSGRSTGASASAQARSALLAQVSDSSFISDLIAADAKSIARTATGLLGSARAALSGKAESVLVRVIRRDTTQLEHLSNKRATVAAHLQNAQSNLDGLTQAKAQTVSSVRDAAIGSLTGARSASGILRVVTKQLERVKSFRSNLGLLAKRGLPQVFLQQLINAGLDGAYTAAALVRANDADFRSISALTTQLAGESSGLGKDAGSLLYDSGINAAKGLIKGLQSEQGNIEKTILDIAKGMQAAIRKALGIKSPSTVFRQLGAYTGQGFTGGLRDEIPAVHRAVSDMVKAPRAGLPKSATTTVGAGSQVVHYVPTTDPNAAAVAVANELEWRNRR